MSTASFTIGFAVQSFPAGTLAPNTLSLVITQPDGTTQEQSLAASATTATATVTQTGAYTASLQALDSSNNPVGSAVSATFTVTQSAPSSVQFSIPSSLTASVA